MNTLDSLFSWFLVATVRGSLLALAVLCIQTALRGRMPARWRYALWLPVVFVLLAPSLPQSRWSIENRVGSKAGHVRQAAFDNAIESKSGGDEVATTPIAPVSPPRFNWRRVAQIGWLAGAAGLLSFAVVAYIRAMRRMRGGAVQPDESLRALLSETTLVSGLDREPRLLASTAVRSPAVSGLLRPTLLLPAEFPGTFTPDEARLVLLHELTHLKRHDLPLNWLLCLLQAIHWCNPVLWFVFARMRADREAACDAQVLAASVDDCRADYGHALLKLEDGLAPSGLSLGFLGIFERAADLRSRVRAVAVYRRAHPAWAALGVALIAGLILVGGTRAQNTVPDGETAKTPSTTANTPFERRRAARERINHKLETIIFPRLEFRETTVRDALEFLRKKSADLDTTEPDADKRGVNIILKIDGAAAPGVGSDPATPAATALPKVNDARLSVSLKNIPLSQAMKYVTSLAGLKFVIGDNAVIVLPLNTETEIGTKVWILTSENVSDFNFQAGIDAKDILVKIGVTFPEGTSAAVSSNGHRLVAKNTQEQLDLIETLLTRENRANAAGGSPTQGSSEISGADLIRKKLNTIVIPRLDFKQATLREAMDFLRRKSVELDTTDTDPARKGVSIVLKLQGAGPSAPPAPSIPGLEAVPGAASPVVANSGNPRITVSLTNVPLMEAFRQVTYLANVKFKIEDFAVAVVPITAEVGVIVTKDWKVKPEMLTAPDQKVGENVVGFLRSKGITFPEGASAVYIPSTSRLIMRNTYDNLERVEAMIAASQTE